MKKIIQKIKENKTTTQISKYFVVGSICTLLDMAILFSLTHFFAIHYIFSSVISFTIGGTLNYFLCTSWIFDFRLIQNHHHEFFFYLLITSFVLVVNTALIWLFTAIFGLYFMISKVIAVFATFGLNFFLRKYLLHHDKFSVSYYLYCK